MGILRYLLDTHTLLWALCESPKLSETAKTAIADENIQKFVSAVSAYEIMYKFHIGKLTEYEYTAKNYLDILKEFGADELPISKEQAHYAGSIDWNHRDPFDRLLVAQAYLNKLTLITDDDNIKSLSLVNTLW